MSEKYFMTEMNLLGKEFKILWYHLDGPGAIKYLPVLLSNPHIKAIQHVTEAGYQSNGLHI
ncbi:MAG TPA: hypothetical protein PKX05_03465 [bacterium]|nr:hypothetical protein [bacterium]